jgi:phosphoglycolate phosphatase-like HAD superfamily hydrolase
VSCATRWRVRFATDTPSEWSDKRDAEELLGKWRGAADDTLTQANEKIRQARKEFIAATEIEIVTVANPNPFQVDDQRPTITFPDGSTIQFAEGVPQGEIDRAMEDAAKEAHPDPDPKDITGTSAELESVRVWEREFLDNGNRIPYPDIFTWNHYFPMSDVAQTLDELAQAGWSIVHASEDRGLLRSDLAESLSAPLTVRYLLVREIGAV